MSHSKIICLSILITLFLTNPAPAANNVEVAARLLNFNYEEFDESGNSFNKETGFIPGFSISTSRAFDSFSNRFGAEAYDGQVDYDGQTQAGSPHTTKTNETLYRLFYQLNWSAEKSRASIYGKILWQQWDRDILSRNNVSGLYEQYRWWAFEAGILTTLFENDADKWQLQLGASKITNGTIKIDLQPFGYGQPILNLGDGYGITAALQYRHQMTDRDEIGLSIEHRYWTFGRSNSRTISNNLETISIIEPRSVTNHTVVSLNYLHYF